MTTRAWIVALCLTLTATGAFAQDLGAGEETPAGGEQPLARMDTPASGPSMISPDTGTPQDPVPRTNPPPPQQEQDDEPRNPPGTYCEGTAIWGRVCFPDDPMNDLFGN